MESVCPLCPTARSRPAQDHVSLGCGRMKDSQLLMLSSCPQMQGHSAHVRHAAGTGNSQDLSLSSFPKAIHSLSSPRSSLFCFLGPHLGVLRVYSQISALGPFLVVLRDCMQYQGSNQSQLTARQVITLVLPL